MTMNADPNTDVTGIILDAMVAALGTTMLNLGMLADEDDFPEFGTFDSVEDAIVAINAWVSRCLDRPVVVVRPQISTLSTEHIGSAVGVLLYLVANPPVDPV